MYRKFSLVNGNSATWDFTNPVNKVFAANPAGLGLRVSADTIRLGNKLKVTDQAYEFVNKTFEVLFLGDTLEEIYADYNRFVSFLTVGNISLLYEIPSQSTAYRIQVLVTELTKTEVKDNGYMLCELTLVPLSFWEDNIKNVLEVDATSATTEGKHYPLERPYYYGTSGFDKFEINILGNMEVPLEITINGETTNPSYSLFDDNDNLLGIGEFDGEFTYVYVNSDETDEQIILHDDNGTAVQYPYNYQNIALGDGETTRITFLSLKQGYNKISFNLGSTFSGSVKVEWRNRYVSI